LATSTRPRALDHTLQASVEYLTDPLETAKSDGSAAIWSSFETDPSVSFPPSIHFRFDRQSRRNESLLQ